jgi:hypothetical protein
MKSRSARLIVVLASGLCAGCATTGQPYMVACRPIWDYIHGTEVDYDKLAAEPGRHSCLDALAETDVTAISEPDRLAFWINAYNLTTLILISRDPGRWSPRQDGHALFADEVVRLGRRRRTLDQVEQDEIAKLTADPRIEFVLSCGTRGCGRLPATLVTGATLSQLLARGEQRFLQDPWNIEVDRSAGIVYTSQLLSPDWRGLAFEHSGRPIAELLSAYLDEPDAAALRQGKLRLVYRTYDWRLNRLRRGYGLP